MAENYVNLGDNTVIKVKELEEKDYKYTIGELVIEKYDQNKKEPTLSLSENITSGDLYNAIDYLTSEANELKDKEAQNLNVRFEEERGELMSLWGQIVEDVMENGPKTHVDRVKKLLSYVMEEKDMPEIRDIDKPIFKVDKNGEVVETDERKQDEKAISTEEMKLEGVYKLVKSRNPDFLYIKDIFSTKNEAIGMEHNGYILQFGFL